MDLQSPGNESIPAQMTVSKGSHPFKKKHPSRIGGRRIPHARPNATGPEIRVPHSLGQGASEEAKKVANPKMDAGAEHIAPDTQSIPSPLGQVPNLLAEGETLQAAPVVPEPGACSPCPLCRVTAYVRVRVRACPQGIVKARRPAIEGSEQSHLGSLTAELLGHRERQHAAETEPREEIGALGLHRSDLTNVMRGHLLDLRVRRHAAIEPLSLKAVHRLVRAELTSQIVVIEDGAAPRMHAEERRP